MVDTQMQSLQTKSKKPGCFAWKIILGRLKFSKMVRNGGDYFGIINSGSLFQINPFLTRRRWVYHSWLKRWFPFVWRDWGKWQLVRNWILGIGFLLRFQNKGNNQPLNVYVKFSKWERSANRAHAVSIQCRAKEVFHRESLLSSLLEKKNIRRERTTVPVSSKKKEDPFGPGILKS